MFESWYSNVGGMVLVRFGCGWDRMEEDKDDILEEGEGVVVGVGEGSYSNTDGTIRRLGCDGGVGGTGPPSTFEFVDDVFRPKNVSTSVKYPSLSTEEEEGGGGWFLSGMVPVSEDAMGSSVINKSL